MIKINLLPSTMRAAEKKPLKAAPPPPPKATVVKEASKSGEITSLGEFGNKILIFALAGVAGVLVLVYAISVLLPTLWQRGNLHHCQKMFKPIEAEYGKLTATSAQKEKDMAILNELNDYTKDRVRWAKILNAVSDVVPSSVQLTKLSVAQTEEMVPSHAPPPVAGPPGRKPSAAPPPMVKSTVQNLELGGIVAKGLLGEEDLKMLFDQIRSHPTFKDFFEQIDLVEVGTMSDLTKKFSIRCRFKGTERSS